MKREYVPEKIEKIPFSLGQTVMTRGVANYVEENDIAKDELWVCLMMHKANDWGCLGKEDWEMNDQAVRSGDDRIFSAYHLSDGTKLWVITEWDRSVTTILFPEEY